MSFKKIAPVTGILVLLATTSAYAFWPQKTEVQAAFCPQLSQEEVYDKNDLGPYRMLISGADDWVFRTQNDIRTDFTLNQATQESLLRLQKAFKQKNIDLVIIFPPNRGLVHVNEISRGDRKKYGLTDPDRIWDNYTQSLADLRKRGLNIVGIDKSDATDDFFYKRNHHWTATGASIMARKVADFVKTLPSWQEIPKKQYHTEQAAQPVAFDSSFQKAFKKICNTQVPPEQVREFTTSVVASPNEQNLFEEQQNQQIVLLGTSNSVEDSSMANFEGFLKQDLSADILNLSYIAGGIDTSIISFINSSAYRESKPRIVLWEVPAYYDFNIMDDKLFSQLRPALQGSCPQQALATKSLDAIGEGRTLLFDLEADESAELAPAASAPILPIAQQQAVPQPFKERYIHFSFGKNVRDPFRLRLDYGNAGTRIQEFERSDSYPADGEFYAMLPDKRGNALLKKVLLETESPMPGNRLQVEVCPLLETDLGPQNDI